MIKLGHLNNSSAPEPQKQTMFLSDPTLRNGLVLTVWCFVLLLWLRTNWCVCVCVVLGHSMAETLTVALRVAEEAIEEAIAKAEEFSDSLVRL